MTAPVFIGDEVSGAGYRLAGAEVHVPTKNDVTRVFRRALFESDFVILTAQCAAMLPSPLVEDAVHRADPLVLIVPDAVERREPPDYRTAVDQVLGIAS